ncbi:MAG: FeoA family protein [Promethearchaeota archaeon]
MGKKSFLHGRNHIRRDIRNSLRKSKINTPLIRLLTECGVGEKLIVLRVNAGLNAKRRLAHLGILPGVITIKKKAAPFRGPIEILVKGSSLVIGRGLATKILVKSIDS